jgi:hypothetical protein
MSRHGIAKAYPVAGSNAEEFSAEARTKSLGIATLDETAVAATRVASTARPGAPL